MNLFFSAEGISNLMIELADGVNNFNNNPDTCTTTSGSAPSDPYLIDGDNYYDHRFLKISKPNANATELLCIAEVEVYG